MSDETLLRGFLVLFIGGVLSFSLYLLYQREDHGESGMTGANRYSTFINPLMLPFLFLFFFAALWVMTKGDLTDVISLLFSLFFSIFLQMCLYYAILLLALPFLRRFFHARTCALLWLLPNFLYLTIYTWMKLPSPTWVIRLKGDWLSTAAAVWAVGFLAVMFWKCAEHLLFRRKLLKHARPVTDPSILSLWQQEQEAMEIKKANYRLVISPDAGSPLSIGLFRPAVRVVLPDRAYTPEELSLIFRHELIHIRREDPGTKLFLTFCTALCWFNPLMWLAMRRSAEDLELSCDETVLLDADDTRRHTYAELILSSAADERGYTTCLSARASSLRYRLKNIITPRKRLTGCILFGVLFVVMLLSSGYVAAAYQGGSGLELIFRGTSEPAHISSCTVYADSQTEMYTHMDAESEDALTAYLSSLQLYKLTGSYSFSDSVREMIVIYEYGDSILGITLKDHTIKIVPFDDTGNTCTYYLEQAVDWDYIMTLLGAD